MNKNIAFYDELRNANNEQLERLEKKVAIYSKLDSLVINEDKVANQYDVDIERVKNEAAKNAAELELSKEDAKIRHEKAKVETDILQAKAEAETAKMSADTEAVKAKIKVEQLKAEAEAAKILAETEAVKARTEVEKLKAEAEAEAVRLKAEADLIRAQNEKTEIDNKYKFTVKDILPMIPAIVTGIASVASIVVTIKQANAKNATDLAIAKSNNELKMAITNKLTKFNETEILVDKPIKVMNDICK